MAQKYKIHIKDYVIKLKQGKPKWDSRYKVYEYIGKEQIEGIIRDMEVDLYKKDIMIYHHDIVELKAAFFKEFDIVVAAGGVVLNEKDELLFIYRKGKWDLPKGKLEKKESKKIAAVREVEEETNAKIIKLEHKLCKTYHTYTLNNKRVLKETHWYLMRGNSSQKLKPQKNEGIEKAIWVEKNDTKKYLKNSYSNIGMIIDNFYDVYNSRKESRSSQTG